MRPTSILNPSGAVCAAVARFSRRRVSCLVLSVALGCGAEAPSNDSVSAEVPAMAGQVADATETASSGGGPASGRQSPPTGDTGGSPPEVGSGGAAPETASGGESAERPSSGGASQEPRPSRGGASPGTRPGRGGAGGASDTGSGGTGGANDSATGGTGGAANSTMGGAGAQPPIDDPGQGGTPEPPVAPEPSAKCGPVLSPVPDDVRLALRLDGFYKKYVSAGGLPVISSDQPDDQALLAACELVNDMLSESDETRQALIQSKARFAIIGKDEGTAEIPEYGYVNGTPEADAINQRARGLGGQVASCGEENILCLRGDRYSNESICVHEFAHTITTYGLYRADRTFQGRLRDAYDNAKRTGLFKNTYAMENEQEYWAEGVQNWYDTNAESIPANGIHNEINTRAEFKPYDPTLYGLVDELLPEATTFEDCHKR